MSNEDVDTVDVGGDDELVAALSAAQPGSPILRLYAMYENEKMAPRCKPGTYTGPATRNDDIRSPSGQRTLRHKNVISTPATDAAREININLSISNEKLDRYAKWIGDQDVCAMAKEIIARRQDEQNAARELNIDPPEPGSPLARAFALNAALRKEHDSAYAKGFHDARSDALRMIDDMRARLSTEICRCGARRLLHSGPMQLGHCEGTDCAGYSPRTTAL